MFISRPSSPTVAGDKRKLQMLHVDCAVLEANVVDLSNSTAVEPVV